MATAKAQGTMERKYGEVVWGTEFDGRGLSADGKAAWEAVRQERGALPYALQGQRQRDGKWETLALAVLRLEAHESGRKVYWMEYAYGVDAAALEAIRERLKVRYASMGKEIAV